MENIPTPPKYQDGSHEPRESVPFEPGQPGQTKVGNLTDYEQQSGSVSPTNEPK